ncbi:hypothetical protein PC123_g14722 [Phytophthora cactorum]|nr:hypothetical protein PC123_g14722 [Phytophthora cactorum]
MEPPRYDDTEMEQLTFAQDVASAKDFMQQLFEEICYQHPPEFLVPGRRRYPELTEGEIKVLVQLFLMDIKEGQQDARKWDLPAVSNTQTPDT